MSYYSGKFQFDDSNSYKCIITPNIITLGCEHCLPLSLTSVLPNQKTAFRDTTQRFVYRYKDYPCFFYLHPSPFNVFFFPAYLPDVHGAYVSLLCQQLAFFLALFTAVFFFSWKKNNSSVIRLKKPSHFFHGCEKLRERRAVHVHTCQVAKWLYYTSEKKKNSHLRLPIEWGVY